MKRATISQHKNKDCVHFDIFLETGEGSDLTTYEISEESWKGLLKGDQVVCFAKKNHRNIYLDFEGTITGNRGELKIVWKGSYDEKNFTKKEKIRINLENLTLLIK